MHFCKRMHTRFLTLLLPAAAGTACGSGDRQTRLNPTVASCNYSQSKQCLEFFTPSAMRTGEESCTETSGSWSNRLGCEISGRVKGCKGTVNALTAYAFWSYDSVDGPDVVQSFCDRGGMYSITGATVTVVNP